MHTSLFLSVFFNHNKWDYNFVVAGTLTFVFLHGCQPLWLMFLAVCLHVFFHSLHDCFSAVDGFVMLCFIFVFLSYQTFGGVDVRGA